MPRTFRIPALLLALALLALAPLGIAQADDINSTKGFRKAVTLAGIREHQAAFQAIADANDGTRASGTDGYDRSVDYVVSKLTAAGYAVALQPFPFAFFRELSPATLSQISPSPASYQTGTFTYSGSGTVTAAVQAVDVVIPPAPVPSSTSGCEASDFAGFTPGNIALIQRGTCTFGQKAQNAEAAGATAVIIFNEGQPGRTALIVGTLGAPVVTIPVVGASFADGVALNSGGVVAQVTTNTISEFRTTNNIIAETPDGDPNQVIAIGAHLDSVAAGPGINDNGSGSATILEVAEVFAAQQRIPRNKLRFMWFGAEELGLIGSTFYVNSLSQAQKDKIALNLNFDMIGSPNFVRFVYDGDNSAFGPPTAAVGPQGSGEIERVFHDYFGSQGLASAETPFSGRSDYGPFIAAGIPAGGLFTGAEGIKTVEEASIYGGTAGLAYDPCYHQACDTYANNSDTGLDQMADAVAHSVLYFSKRDFAQNPLLNPSTQVTGTNGGGEGGGLHDHDHEAVDR